MKYSYLPLAFSAVLLTGCASVPETGAAPSVRGGVSSLPAASATTRRSAASASRAAVPTSVASAQPTMQANGNSLPPDRSSAGFAAWVASFRQQAAGRGVAPSTLDTAFGDAEFIPRVIELDNRQPEFSRPIWDYLDTAVSSTRVSHGQDQLATYAATATQAEQQYGVSRYIVTAIWGMESNYGQNFGHYETIDALATLGYDGRREDFAEDQLYAAMKILANGDISRQQMQGSWAGAMGNTQFLPTSFLAYAVDADGDGKRDIWGSIPDVFASTANYLHKNGWQSSQPWGREVVLPAGFDYALADGDTRRSTASWQAAGVQPIDNRGLPGFDSAAIIAPAGAQGPAFMVGPNFRAILRYNNATSYALAVGLLADEIAGQPGVQRPWPRDLASLSHDQMLQLQTALNQLGYGSGTPDGIMGPNTQSAIRGFQRANAMTADGYPTQALLDKVNAKAR